MRMAHCRYVALVAIVSCIVMLVGASSSSAHCDTMDGPVIVDARKALETGNVDLVLAWVQRENEPEIKKAFEKTLQVRRLSPDAGRREEACV